MNKIKAVLHNKVLYELVKDNKYLYDYIESKYKNYKKNKLIVN